MSLVYVSRAPSRSHHHAGDGRARVVGLQAQGLRVGEQGDVGVLERRAHAEDLGVGLGVHQAREAVARRAAHARAVGHVVLGEHHAAGRVERLVPGRLEVVGELLDARLVADRRERVGRAGGRLGRVLAARAVHVVELLGARVVGLHLVVADGPRRRDAVVVAQLAEVLLAQAVQRGAVELGGAADAVVHLRLEGLAVAVVPRVLRTRSGCRRRRRARASSAARAGASRPARAGGCASPRGRGAGRASLRRHRIRSRSRRSRSSRTPPLARRR